MNVTLTPDIVRQRPTLERAAGWAGIVGPVLFVATFLVLEAIQTPEYDRASETISALAARDHGWVQSLNFAVFGALSLVFAAGLHRSVAPSRGGVAGPALIGVSAVATFVAAAFPMRLDDDGMTYSPTGHLIGGFMFFSTAAVSLLVLSFRLRKDPRWTGLATYAAAAGVVALIGFFVMGTLVIPDDGALHEYAGVGQRVLILLVVFPCRVALAVRMLRLSTR
jgi:hypothetical protein